MKVLKGLLGMAILAGSVMYLNSCSQDATQETQSTLALTAAANVDYMVVDPSTAEDGNPCYTLVFPLTVKVGDKEVVVNTPEELAKLNQRNPTSARVILVYPYSVKLVATGETVVVNNDEDLKQIMKNCRGDKRDTVRRDTLKFGCYKLAFPLTVKLADGSTKTVNSIEELNALRRATTGRVNVTIQFPFNVILKDGTTVTVTTVEELREIEKNCRGKRPGRIGG
ncbi:MAG: hypothetical protein K1X68_05045 [Saprospiraceae bacterium]|nr:hypothetical protein [Saprospiraceae bacterium]HMW38686.1 hypothetical protein [Saprospiraceae bacterium]HMX88182.1 hypothetical protein [Saprospiraceae bacterium]HMZ39920.1 hypothetical protein [Saprospiraceae bacterium]HNA63876.1 hypothetical protein [Saprospiraceae bacterium]